MTSAPPPTDREIAELIADNYSGAGGLHPFLSFTDRMWLRYQIEFALAAKRIATERETRAADVKAARDAELPAGYQWGRDAMEQFNFGKKRAALAIEALSPPDPAPTKEG